MRQLHFFKTEAFKDLNRRTHGGEIRKGKRKLARPFDPKRPIHIVLRSSKAHAEWSFLRARNEKRVRHIVYAQASRSGVRIYQYANSGNHLHLLLRAKTRSGLAKFLRSASGMIARAVTGSKKGQAVSDLRSSLSGSRSGRSSRPASNRFSESNRANPAPSPASAVRAFWDALAFSRIVEWGKEFVRVRDYLVLNELEGLGWWDFSPRKQRPGFS